METSPQAAGFDQPRADDIVIVVASLGGGGAERVIVDLSDYLAARGRKVTVLTLSGDDADAFHLSAAVSRERMEIRRPAYSLASRIWFTLKHLRAMRRRIVALRPSVVLSFIDQTNVRVLSCLLGTGIPVVISERIHPAYGGLTKAWSWGRRLLYPYANALVVQTFEAAAWCQANLRSPRVIIIPNAVRSLKDLAPPSFGEPRSPCVLAIGRLTHQKGFDLLLHAFSESRLAEEGWRLVILGEGPDQKTLLEQARALGIADQLELKGYVTDIGAWMAQCRMFVMSSRYEGFPNALLEAMQAGLPCISFDCKAGPRNMIRHGVNGLLVAPEDIAGMAQALRQLADRRDFSEALGREARKVSETFSQDKVLVQWLDVLDAIAATGKEP